MTDKYTVWKGRLKVIQLKIKNEKDKKILRRYVNYRPTLREKAIILRTEIKETIITISIIKIKG